MNFEQIVDLCRDELAVALVVPTDDIPYTPWHDLMYDFAAAYDGTTDLSDEQLRRVFRQLIAEEQAVKEQIQVKYQTAWQRHHDVYVRRARAGTLDPIDQMQYMLAMVRERHGKVKPLPDEEPLP